MCAGLLQHERMALVSLLALRVWLARRAYRLTGACRRYRPGVDGVCIVCNVPPADNGEAWEARNRAKLG